MASPSEQHNVYIDMCADMFHYGHVNQLKNCRETARGGKVIVGIHSDATIQSYKRVPIMNMEERVRVVESCKYVDLVVRDAPLSVTDALIEKYQISRVIVSNQRTMEETDRMYSVPRRLGLLYVMPHTPEISTTNIIKRIVKTYSASENHVTSPTKEKTYLETDSSGGS